MGPVAPCLYPWPLILRPHGPPASAVAPPRRGRRVDQIIAPNVIRVRTAKNPSRARIHLLHPSLAPIKGFASSAAISFCDHAGLSPSTHRATIQFHPEAPKEYPEARPPFLGRPEPLTGSAHTRPPPPTAGASRQPSTWLARH
ncbi:hypothetical protein U9M48_008410, partial [Paspalum notatum var. saurae]